MPASTAEAVSFFPPTFSALLQRGLRLVEQHCLIDLDGDGYKEPYIVTFDLGTGNMLRIVARFRWQDIEYLGKTSKIVRIRAEEYFTKYSFIPSPDGGIYDLMGTSRQTS